MAVTALELAAELSDAPFCRHWHVNGPVPARVIKNSQSSPHTRSGFPQRWKPDLTDPLYGTAIFIKRTSESNAGSLFQPTFQVDEPMLRKVKHHM